MKQSILKAFKNWLYELTISWLRLFSFSGLFSITTFTQEFPVKRTYKGKCSHAIIYHKDLHIFNSLLNYSFHLHNIFMFISILRISYKFNFFITFLCSISLSKKFSWRYYIYIIIKSYQKNKKEEENLVLFPNKVESGSHDRAVWIFTIRQFWKEGTQV